MWDESYPGVGDLLEDVEAGPGPPHGQVGVEGGGGRPVPHHPRPPHRVVH